MIKPENSKYWMIFVLGIFMGEFIREIFSIENIIQVVLLFLIWLVYTYFTLRHRYWIYNITYALGISFLILAPIGALLSEGTLVDIIGSILLGILLIYTSSYYKTDLGIKLSV